MHEREASALSLIWLSGIALALGTLLIMAVPLIVGPAFNKPDWVGFSGNVVGAAVTLFAAFIAWSAVQEQIRAQHEVSKRQLRLDALSLLIKQAEVIEQERALVSELQLSTHFAVLPVVVRVDVFGILKRSIPRGIAAAERNLRRFEELELKFNSSTERTWVFPKLQEDREQLRKYIIVFGARVERQIRTLKALDDQAATGAHLQLTPDQDEGITLFGLSGDADKSSQTYATELKAMADANARRMVDFRADVGI